MMTWEQLTEAGIENHLDESHGIYATALAFDFWITSDEKVLTIKAMTDLEVIKEAQLVTAEAADYKAKNLKMLDDRIADALDRNLPPIIINQLETQKEALHEFPLPQCVTWMPKFIRLCIEMRRREINLEDVFYGRPT